MVWQEVAWCGVDGRGGMAAAALAVAVDLQTGSQWHADTVELITTLLRIAVKYVYGMQAGMDGGRQGGREDTGEIMGGRGEGWVVPRKPTTQPTKCSTWHAPVDDQYAQRGSG